MSAMRNALGPDLNHPDSQNDPISYRRIRGSCHCGNIRVTFDRPDSGPAIPVRAWGWGPCTKPRAVWTSHPDGQFYLRIADDSRVRRYRFGTKTADFHVQPSRVGDFELARA